MKKIETPKLDQIITNQNKNNNIQNQKKEIENSKVDCPKKVEIKDDKEKKGKYKSLKFFRNLVLAPKNKATLKEIYQSLETIKNYAKLGIERISIGMITHSAPSLDISLEVEVHK